jgi:oligopeptide/dipeptide ABC transporter ATP-binding protein
VNPLLEAQGLVKHFAARRGSLLGRRRAVRAVDGVDLCLAPGECLAVVGESGSGKTTLGRLLIRLLEPTAGRVLFRGQDLSLLAREELRRLRRRFQIVFQDPYGSLNPRMRIGRALAEPMAVHGLVPKAEQPARVAELLERVGLHRDAAGRFPHEFSGGQRQRIAIARALATGPELIVADEPVSALDVAVRAQVVNLLAELQSGLALALVFIAHDLAVVEQIADRVAVLYLGRIVEQGERRRLFAAPQHPYTVSLLAAVPVPDPAWRRPAAVVSGEPASPLDPPPGCPFHPRCPIARPRCASEVPAWREVAPGHFAACHFAGEAAPPLR